MLKKVVAFCSAIALSLACVFPIVCLSADNSNIQDIYTDTRYSGFSPVESIENFFSDTKDNVVEAFNRYIRAVGGFVSGTDPEYFPYPKDYQYTPSNFDSVVQAQRVKDLVDYANQSTQGLTTGKGIVAFTAKHKIILSDALDPAYELDTLYFWRDYNHTIATDFTGVQIGEFFLQPNSFYCTREFSDGRFMSFYGDATQFDLVFTGLSDVPIYLQTRRNATFTIINPDGTVEPLTISKNSLYNSSSSSPTSNIFALSLHSSSSTNSISTTSFLKQAQNYTRFTDFIENGTLSNIELICNNASNGQGYMMLPNNKAGSDGWGDWYISYGSFLGNYNLNNSFSINNNYSPQKAPITLNPDSRLNVDNTLNTVNVDNYSDLGVTYNNITGKFDLDVGVLAAGLAAQLTPKFQGTFDLVYDNQPAPNSSDWTNNNFNYNSDFNNTIIDFNDIVDSLAPSSPWVPPTYPPVNTSAFIPAQYPTIPTQTFQPNYVKSVGDSLTLGWDIFDGLGLCAIIVPIVIMLLLWRLTGR